MQQKSQPYSITGKLFTDNRGSVRFINDFSFLGVKRFYQVTQNISQPIRAFHAHLYEAKYVYVTQGAIHLILAEVDKLPYPSKKLKLHTFLLSASAPSIVFIPPKFANGFKVLEAETQVLFFSDKTVSESEGDDYRLDFDYWGAKVWDTV